MFKPLFERPIRCPGIARALLAGALSAAFAGASAQDFPNKPIRIVVPFAAGGATDTLARALAEKMAPKFGQPVLVDNKPGAGGNLGTDIVAKAAPDGHVVMLGLTGSLLTNTFLYQKLPYDPRKDLALVSIVAIAPVVLLVNASVPVKTAPELLKYIAANKSKLSYGSWGAGSYAHLAGAHMSLKLDADMSHVAYKGEAPMMQDLIGGQIPMAYASLSQAKQHIESGRVRALGVTGDSSRISALPDVPTLAEQGLQDGAYRVVGWFALAAPAKTPKSALNRIGAEFRAACGDPDIKTRIDAMGFEPKCSTPQAAAEIYQRDLPIWEQLVKQTGATLD